MDAVTVSSRSRWSINKEKLPKIDKHHDTQANFRSMSAEDKRMRSNSANRAGRVLSREKMGKKKVEDKPVTFHTQIKSSGYNKAPEALIWKQKAKNRLKDSKRYLYLFC